MPAISYNGIEFPFAQTMSFEQNAMLDPTGNTDFFVEKFDITVQSIFTADVLPLLFPNMPSQVNGVEATAADIMDVVRSKLLKPRRAFSVTCNGQELIPGKAGVEGTVDAQNGPIPQFCNVTQLTDTAFLVTWKVVACYWENNALRLNEVDKVSNLPGNPVLYNRWSEVQELDYLLNTRKTREGKYVIRSDNQQGLIVDKFRIQMAVLGVPPGFLRESSYYKVDPSGLGLEYRFVDVQQYVMPPAPAYKATGDYTESHLRYGAQRWGEMYLRLEGSAATSQSKMLNAAIGICSAKLRANGALLQNFAPANGNNGAKGQIGILDSMHVKVGMYENWVEVRMRARLKQSKRLGKAAVPEAGIEAKAWDFNPAAYVFTPGSDGVKRDIKWPYRGTAGDINNRILLQAAAYYDPSLRNTQIDKEAGQLDAPGQLEVGQAGLKLEP